MPTTYYTHWNGARPYKVAVYSKEKQVKVYHEQACVLVSPYTRLWIGRSPKTPMTLYSGGHGRAFDGNTILLQHSSHPLKYTFVGHRIFTFTALVPIVSYVSPVGNSDVPYPFATDAEGNVYLLIEDVVMKANNVTTQEHIKTHPQDPYSVYYQATLITPDISFVPPNPPLAIQQFHDIQSYYIDKEEYTLRYEPDPAAYYEDVMKRLRGRKMYVKLIKTTKPKVLTKAKYVALMEEWGKLHGLERIPHIHVAHDPKN